MLHPLAAVHTVQNKFTVRKYSFDTASYSKVPVSTILIHENKQSVANLKKVEASV
jgi:hypothetical protein